MSAAQPTSRLPIVTAKGVVAAPPEVAMRNTCAGVGTSSSMPGTRCARSTIRISCSMSRSSLMPLVDPDRGGDAGGLELVERGNARAQPEVRRAVVTDTGPGFRQPIDVRLVKPDAVA